MKNNKQKATSLNAKFNKRKEFVKGDLHFRDKLVNTMMQNKLTELGFECFVDGSRFRTNAPVDMVKTLMKFAMKAANTVCFGENITDQEAELLVNDILQEVTDDQGKKVFSDIG